MNKKLLAFISVSAVLLAGCGLSDYERQMELAQDRVKRFNDENELLNLESVAPPTRRVVPKEPPPDPKAPPKDPKAKDPKAGAPKAKDPKAPKETGKTTKEPAKEQREPIFKHAFFLRLPRGFQSIAEPSPRFDIAYRYPKAGIAGAMPPAKVATPAGEVPFPTGGGLIGEIYLAFGVEPQATFVDRVAKSLPRNTEPTPSNPVNIGVVDRREALAFDVREFSDSQSTWLVYAHGDGAETAAVVFRVDKSQRAAAIPLIELCLGTFAIGPEAESVARSYSGRK
jgi:hypothetical protein